MPTRWTSLLIVASLLCTPASSQTLSGTDPAGPNSHYFFGTFGPSSPSAPSVNGPITVMRAATGSATQTQVTATDIGLSPTGSSTSIEISAISYFNDKFGCWNILQDGPLGRHHRVEMTIKPRTSGSQSVFKKYKTYAMDYVMGCYAATVPNQANICGAITTIGPFEVVGSTAASTSDSLRGLAWEMNPVLPAFFTVTPASVTAVRALHSSLAGFNSCDILFCSGTGAVPQIVAYGSDSRLRFAATDHITALAMDPTGCAVIGFAHDSYSVVNSRQIGAVGNSVLATGNTLFYFVPSTASGYINSAPSGGYAVDTVGEWASAAQLGGLTTITSSTTPGTVDIRQDVRIADPGEQFLAGETLPVLTAGYGNNYVSRHTLSVNNLDGGVFGQVYCSPSSSYTINVKLSNAGSFTPISWALFASYGELDGTVWNWETFPALSPPTGYSTLLLMPYILRDYTHPSGGGCVAIAGTTTLDTSTSLTGFGANYLVPQLSSGTLDWSVTIGAPGYEYKAMLTLIAYINGNPDPLRSQTMTIYFEDLPTRWPKP